jgi:hypothetical protein
MTAIDSVSNNVITVTFLERKRRAVIISRAGRKGDWIAHCYGVEVCKANSPSGCEALAEQLGFHWAATIGEKNGVEGHVWEEDVGLHNAVKAVFAGADKTIKVGGRDVRNMVRRLAGVAP